MTDIAVSSRSSRAAWGAEIRATLALAWPLAMTNLLQTAMTTTDVALIGRLGPDELAASALATNLFFACLIFAIGMVTATADGRGRLRGIKIDPSVVQGGDIEMLEDLVLAAVAEAQNRAEAVHEEEMRKLTGGFTLPFSLGDVGPR